MTSPEKKVSEDAQQLKATESVLLTLQIDYENSNTMVLPGLPYATVVEDTHTGLTTISFPINMQGVEVGQFLPMVCCVATDDPTPIAANHIISLGYYATRFFLYGCKVISLNPFTVQNHRLPLQGDCVEVKAWLPLRRVVR